MIRVSQVSRKGGSSLSCYDWWLVYLLYLLECNRRWTQRQYGGCVEITTLPLSEIESWFPGHPTRIKSLYRMTSVSSPFHQIPWSRILLEKLTALELANKFPAFYGTRRYIAVFTSARHLSLFWATPIQSMLLHPTSHIQVVFINSIFLWDFFFCQRATWWHCCLRHCSSSLKVAVSITYGINGFSQWLLLSGRSVVLGLTQSLTEMSTRFSRWVVLVVLVNQR